MWQGILHERIQCFIKHLLAILASIVADHLLRRHMQIRDREGHKTTCGNSAGRWLESSQMPKYWNCNQSNNAVAILKCKQTKRLWTSILLQWMIRPTLKWNSNPVGQNTTHTHADWSYPLVFWFLHWRLNLNWFGIDKGWMIYIYIIYTVFFIFYNIISKNHKFSISSSHHQITCAMFGSHRLVLQLIFHSSLHLFGMIMVCGSL